MDWTEALEIVVRETRNKRYRVLCDESNPKVAERDGYRAIVVSMAVGEPVAYPAIATQAKTLGRSVVRWARSGFRVASAAEARRRREICIGCPFFDREQRRCRKCGCSSLVKPWMNSEHCPIKKW